MSTAAPDYGNNVSDHEADAMFNQMLEATLPAKKRGCPCVFNSKPKPSLEVRQDKVAFKERNPRLYRFLVITAIVLAIAAAVGIALGAIWGTVGFKAAGDWLQTAFSHNMSVLNGFLYFGATTLVIAVTALYFGKRYLDKQAAKRDDEFVTVIK